MPTIPIPNVGNVKFPDSMKPEEIHKHASRLHAIHSISKRTGSVDVTRSLPFAQKLAAKGGAPAEVKHFVASAEKLPDGRHYVDFATGRHALKAVEAQSGNLPERSEVIKMLGEDLHEATARRGTRADWLEAEKRGANGDSSSQR